MGDDVRRGDDNMRRAGDGHSSASRASGSGGGGRGGGVSGLTEEDSSVAFSAPKRARGCNGRVATAGTAAAAGGDRGVAAIDPVSIDDVLRGPATAAAPPKVMDEDLGEIARARVELQVLKARWKNAKCANASQLATDKEEARGRHIALLRDALNCAFDKDKGRKCPGDEDFLCDICMDLLVAAHALPCGHAFCLSCIQDWFATKREPGDAQETCPKCRAPVRPRKSVA